MKTALGLVVYYLDPVTNKFLGPFTRHILPAGTVVAVADSRCTLVMDPDEPVPLPWQDAEGKWHGGYTYRVNYGQDNPRFERYTGDPTGADHPCFSAGFKRGGQSFWTNPALIDQGEFCLTFILEEGDFCFDYAQWKTESLANGADSELRDVYEINPLERGRGEGTDNTDPILFGTVPGSIHMPPPIVGEPLPPLPTSAHQGQSPQAAWEEGWATALEKAARNSEQGTTMTAAILRAMK